MTLVDLLLARGALRPGSPHSCVTLRMDLNVNAAAFATATHIRGLTRHSFADDNLTMGTCELRGDDGVLLATGMGMFVSIDAALPMPFIPTEPHTDSTSLTELLEFVPDMTRTTVTWPIREWTANPSGVVHGGVQAAALFAAIENLAVVDTGAPVAFGNCSVEYLRPLPADDTELTVGVTATRRGRQFATYDAQLYAADGRVGTKATATLRLPVT
ncbi:PaaI family thioesterase [Gordonia sp. TBRC 11910]|uniref:PaaI family thioesterase n=1 Tax=Gordonia asplenii TaxID=2725283 RepID=A0A848L185_9ACTN|nr:PaaI family thioesterase [Gordonia asplenii]NMO01428.1 PaaI family thioesterase [Gordonia asplenii]